MAMVFQNYALYPHMNAYDNMAFGLKMRGLGKAEIESRVQHAARMLGLQDVLKKKPRTLSGGQRQRVAMGRAIVREPLAFLMDEPLSNLDAKLRVQMRAEIARIQRDLAVTTIYVTHDQSEAMTLGDRVCVMRNGLLQQVDAPQRLYDAPVNLFVAEFIGSPAMNLVEAELAEADGLVASFGPHSLRIGDAVQAARPALRAHLGRKVALGIRPEESGGRERCRRRADARGPRRHSRGHGLGGLPPLRPRRSSGPQRRGDRRGEHRGRRGGRLLGVRRPGHALRRAGRPHVGRPRGGDGRARGRYRAGCTSSTSRRALRSTRKPCSLPWPASSPESISVT